MTPITRDDTEHGVLYVRLDEAEKAVLAEREESMTRAQILDALMLLSALESWSFANKAPLPDYLHDRLASVLDALEKELLK